MGKFDNGNAYHQVIFSLLTLKFTDLMSVWQCSWLQNITCFFFFISLTSAEGFEDILCPPPAKRSRTDAFYQDLPKSTILTDF